MMPVNFDDSLPVPPSATCAEHWPGFHFLSDPEKAQRAVQKHKCRMEQKMSPPSGHRTGQSEASWGLQEGSPSVLAPLILAQAKNVKSGPRAAECLRPQNVSVKQQIRNRLYLCTGKADP